MKHRLFLFILVFLMVIPIIAQDDMATPSVDVGDQAVLDGTVTIASAYSEGPGFIAIHIDNGSGGPGPVIGYRSLNAGWNFNIGVWISAADATPMMFAMLHADTGEVGVYEFGTVEGADGPVRVNDQVVNVPFNVAMINGADQFLIDNRLTLSSVILPVDGFVAIHSDNEGRPGPVVGYTAVPAGKSEGVSIALENPTTTLWPMLHQDTGAVGTYEFGTVEGADGPVRMGGRTAVTAVWTVPHVRVSPQIVTHGAGMEMMDMAPTLMATSVLSEGPGWLAIHSDNGGSPGPVVGAAQVSDGLNTNVTVELTGEGITPVLWPMLHVDTGAVGTYEFGTVEGADGPVRVNEQVVTFAVNTAPSIVFSGTITGSTLTVDAALIDSHGWLAIHSDNGGSPGPVLGAAPLLNGYTTNITIELMGDMGSDKVFPMLHYDTGEAGVYEFGTVEGADGPVRVGESVVVGPLTPTVGE